MSQLEQRTSSGLSEDWAFVGAMLLLFLSLAAGFYFSGDYMTPPSAPGLGPASTGSPASSRPVYTPVSPAAPVASPSSVFHAASAAVPPFSGNWGPARSREEQLRFLNRIAQWKKEASAALSAVTSWHHNDPIQSYPRRYDQTLDLSIGRVAQACGQARETHFPNALLEMETSLLQYCVASTEALRGWRSVRLGNISNLSAANASYAAARQAEQKYMIALDNFLTNQNVRHETEVGSDGRVRVTWWSP